MAYGSPGDLTDVEAYYREIRGGRPPSPEAVEELRTRYLAIGGRSPLHEVTTRQAVALEAALNARGGAWRVYVGMRHWRPWIADAVERMAQDGIRRAVGLALAAHASRMSTGAYVDAAQKAFDALGGGRRPEVTFVRSWATAAGFVEALARRLVPAIGRSAASAGASGASREVHVIFTAHSLPERIRTWDDPYPREVEATSRAVAKRARLGDGMWSVAYQSQGRTAEPWLGPGLGETLERLAASGARSIVVCPVGFVADHLEVLYDIDIEAAEHARALGLELTRTASLNDAPDFIEALASVVQAAAAHGGDDGI